MTRLYRFAETSGEAAAALFLAMHQAAIGHNATAAETLRKFLELVAQEYGRENGECFL